MIFVIITTVIYHPYLISPEFIHVLLIPAYLGEFPMVQWFRPASLGHEITIHDLTIMGLSPGQVEFECIVLLSKSYF